jgi:hypothetical protein
MASQAELAASTPLDELGMHTPLMYFLIHNVEELSSQGMTSYLEAMNRTTFLLTEESSTNIKNLNVMIAGTAGGVLALFVLLLLALLLPMVNHIDNNKIAVFRELVGMPPSVFPVVGKRYADRLESVHEEVSLLELIGIINYYSFFAGWPAQLRERGYLKGK